MGFLNQMNIFSSTYDVLWRKYDVYEVIVNLSNRKRGIKQLFLLNCHWIILPSNTSDSIIVSTPGLSLQVSKMNFCHS